MERRVPLPPRPTMKRTVGWREWDRHGLTAQTITLNGLCSQLEPKPAQTCPPVLRHTIFTPRYAGGDTSQPPPTTSDRQERYSTGLPAVGKSRWGGGMGRRETWLRR